MRKHVTAGRLFGVGLALLAVVLALYVVPSSEYIFLPDKAQEFIAEFDNLRQVKPIRFKMEVKL